jgi:thiamine-phosphate pyrophosphorylase
MLLDLSLYVITDRLLAGKKPLREVVEKAMAGGATCIQLREKGASSREIFLEAVELRKVTREKRVPFLVNDRLDIALAVGADGVHLGQDDLPLKTARKIMPPGMILGASVDDPGQARLAERLGATYLGAGAVFATATKPDAQQSIGLQTLAAICREVKIPVVAIGGINGENAGRAIAAGAAGVAVIGSIMAAPDITAAVRKMREQIHEARSR